MSATDAAQTNSTDSARTPEPARSATPAVLTALTALIALPQIALGGWIVQESYRSWGEMSPSQQRDAMVGPDFGWFIAAIVAAPSVLALLLACVGVALGRRRTASLVLTTVGLIVTTLSGALIAWFACAMLNL